MTVMTDVTKQTLAPTFQSMGGKKLIWDTLPFKPEEYQRRLAATRSAMRKEGLDALVVFHQENMFYLGNYDQIGYWVYQAMIVTADDQPLTVVVRKMDGPFVLASGIIEDVRIWLDEGSLSGTDMTAAVVAEKVGLKGKRIGIERRSHTLLPYYYDQLREALGPAEIVDGSDIISRLRLVKSPAEADYMRRAGEIMDAGTFAAWDELKAGVRECDVHAAVMNAMYRAGGDNPALAPPIGSGPRTLGQTHGSATERVVQSGEPFLLEVGGCCRRYHAVNMRSACVGVPTKEMRQMHDSIFASTEVGLSKVKPGATMADIAHAMHEELERHGHSRRGRHHGYGLGLGYQPSWVDHLLRIKETDPHVLEPGMAFLMYDGAFAEDQSFYFSLGDPVLVTSTGYERLSKLPRELTVR
jgi:ectoine hydrolase